MLKWTYNANGHTLFEQRVAHTGKDKFPMPPKCNIPDRICEICGKQFYVPISTIKNGGGRFCSRLCANEGQRNTGPRLQARFWSKVNKRSPNECWPFAGGMGSTGRGVFSIGGKCMNASRAAWIVTHGPIPDELWVLHKCDNGPCCNPAHLFTGTPQDNTDDMMQKHRHVFVKPPQTDQSGEKSYRAILTSEQVKQIRALYAAHELNQFQLARQFKVSRTCIQSVVDHRTWRHLI